MKQNEAANPSEDQPMLHTVQETPATLQHVTPQRAKGIAFTDMQLMRVREHLRLKGIDTDSFSLPLLPGYIRLDPIMMERAMALATAYHRACKACYDRMFTDAAFRDELLNPYPRFETAVRNAILASPFFMRFFRMDTYIDPSTGQLRLIEVNTAPGAMPEYVTLDEVVSAFPLAQTTQPQWPKASLDSAIRCFQELWTEEGIYHPRTLGIIAQHDDDKDYAGGARLYGEAVKRVSGADPVYCILERDRYLHPMPGYSQHDVNTLELLFYNPTGGTYEDDEAFTEWARDHGVFVFPPRNNLLFTNKAFLTVLQRSLPTLGLSREDTDLLAAALIYSFPLPELSAHLETMHSWKGIVLKRDLGSTGSNVFVYPFERYPYEKTLRMITDRVKDSDQATWTVQEYVPPASVMIGDERYFYDLMSYVALDPEPSILFASRPFHGTKANIGFGAKYGTVLPM